MTEDRLVHGHGEGRRVRRRTVLKGAAAFGVVARLLGRTGMAGAAASAEPTGTTAAAGAAAAAGTEPGPRWIAFGPDPTSQLRLSWSTGTAAGPNIMPSAPQVRWGTTTAYGSVKDVRHSRTVPAVPGGGGPAEQTIYSTVRISGLEPATTYHYSVSNDGTTWSADATFSTAPEGPSDFRFTAFGDQGAGKNAGRMAALVASRGPAFHLQAGDLAYATPHPLRAPDTTGFEPAQWDTYLALVGPNAAQSVPWQASVGAHEVEPLTQHGYAGFVTRFPQSYAAASGSPVAHTFRYGNVAVIHLDGNDLSAQETLITGYTKRAQTQWLRATLADCRAKGSGVDFVVVVVNCCCYSSNQEHGSDGGLRDVWGRAFDRYEVDLVISGHVHAYERTHPIRAEQPTASVPTGGIAHPARDGTTYICAGGGGNVLYTKWFGPTGAGDAGSATDPKIWRWTGGDTAAGGTGHAVNVTDTASGFSAVRRAVFHCLVVDVTAPHGPKNRTTMRVRAVMPTQTASTVTGIDALTVIDEVTLVRTGS